MKFLKNLLGLGPDPRLALLPLYNSIVAEARDPAWYAEMGVPDTIDGRFDMVSAVLALTLFRSEAAGETGVRDAVLLTELFIADMEGQVRELGIGDVVVGKHVGKMVAAMGGRLGAYRDLMGDSAALEEALARNLWRGEPSPEAKPALVAARMQALTGRLAATEWPRLVADGLPR